jgi:two-component sensor histidine kinase
LDDGRGRCSHDLLKTVFPEPLGVIGQKLRTDGQWRGRLQHTGRDGQEIWTESDWRVRGAEASEDCVVVESNTDITARVVAERRRETLALELDHRVKNTLAVVQGLARLTFGAADAADVRRFEERLIALSQAHNLLLREHWDHAQLKDIISVVTSSLGVAERVHVDGPDAALHPNAAVSYSLAFHELCTNAVKHGSLRAPQGRVEVIWNFRGAENEHIHLFWREIGGEPVNPPEREGFGSRLIQRTVARELGTPVQLRFEPTGLVCEFDGPVQKQPAL